MTTHAFAPMFQPLFVASAAPAVDADAEPSFALVQSGPAVDASEVESHLEAIEVTVRWGTQVLKVAHLDPGPGAAFDFELPEGPAAIVRGGAVIVPSGASAIVGTESFVGPQEIALGPSMNVTLDIGALRFEIATVRKGKKLAPVGLFARLAGGATGTVGLSFLGHAAIVASLAMFMPKMAADDADAAAREQLLMMQKLVTAAAEREAETVPRPETGEAGPQGGGSTGERHAGPEGVSGTTKTVTTAGRTAVRGHEPDAALSRQQQIEQARNFGMVELLGTLGGGAGSDAPASPWGEEPRGNQDRNARGLMFSSTIDDAMGFGFGLSGEGEGGGGDGKGVGLDHVSTVGGGSGNPNGKWGVGKCTDPNGKCDGFGIGHGPGAGGYNPKAIRMREPGTTTNGRIPAEVIQRIVRQNFGRFRLCYESGLRNNPGLNGRVVTSFVIGRDGLVAAAKDGGSDLPDQQVTQCIVRSFSNLSFPPPDGGVATVTYPIILSPGDS
jgi:hypothetical protein